MTQKFHFSKNFEDDPKISLFFKNSKISKNFGDDPKISLDTKII